MPLEALRERLPAYARDISLNLTNLIAETVLTDQRKWGVVLACAHAIGVPGVLRIVEAESAAILSPEAHNAAKAAAALMGMNNVYFRALHIMHNKDYEGLRSGLRMNILTNPGIDKIDFELWAFAVSAVNGCGLCMDSHEKALRDHKVSLLEIQAALRLASVIHAVSAIVRAEDALAPQPAA